MCYNIWSEFQSQGIMTNSYFMYAEQAETVKYLGLHFDKRLNWKQHTTKTRKHLNLKARELYWILGRHSPLSLLNKTLIYKVILKPVWTCGIELWGCASSSNIEIIQIPVKNVTTHNAGTMVCHKSDTTSRLMRCSS